MTYKPLVRKVAESGKGKGQLVFVYLFFIIHMGAFGTTTFFLTYGEQDLYFASMFGGLAIFVYTVFYLVIFGFDEVKWLIIGSLLGILGIYGWLEELAYYFIPQPGSGASELSLAGGREKYTSFDQFPMVWHLLPGAFFIMYEFLLRNALTDLLGARIRRKRKRLAGMLFIGISVAQFIISRFS